MTFAVSTVLTTLVQLAAPEQIATESRGAIVQLHVLSKLGPGSGTGFFVSADGRIATNAHVIADATEVRAELPDGRSFDAGFLAQDETHDLAIVKIDHDPGVYLPLGDDPKMGQEVLVLGHPLGQPLTLTRGIIAGDVRDDAESEGADVTFTAEIQPGSSGSPLLSAGGKVVAVATGKSLAEHATYYATAAQHLTALLETIDDDAEPEAFPITPGFWLNVVLSLLFLGALVGLGFWSQRSPSGT